MGHSHREPVEPQDPVGAVVVAVSHDRAQIERHFEEIAGAMTDRGFASAAQFAVRLAWEEAISNAIHHGNQDRADGRIEVAYHVEPQRLLIRVTDEGAGFDPSAVIDPTLDENLECPSGRGLLLMRAYMTRVEIPPPGNTVRLVLDLPTAP